MTGKAEEKAVALGVAIGSGYLYKTTFEKEVYSDLYGERGCLMGGIHGMFLAQYEVLRERGHSPSEAFNETVEEATQSLYPLIGANGMDYMYAACSTTARRGAIDWSKKFKDTLKPVFNELYDSVKDGRETTRSLEYNSAPDYREKFEKEMEEIRGLEIWRAGKAVRYDPVISISLLEFSLTIFTAPCDLRTSKGSVLWLDLAKASETKVEYVLGWREILLVECDLCSNAGDCVLRKFCSQPPKYSRTRQGNSDICGYLIHFEVPLIISGIIFFPSFKPLCM